MTRFVNPNPQFFDNNGKVLASGSLTFYEPGTTDAKTTYSDYDQTTANSPASVITLDANGRPDTDIFFRGVARVILKDSGGSTIWDKDYCGVDDALSYGNITGATTVAGVGLSSVTNPATGQYRLVFDTAAPDTPDQTCVATYQGGNSSYFAVCEPVNTTTVDVFLFDDAGTATSATPIGVTRRIIY